MHQFSAVSSSVAVAVLSVALAWPAHAVAWGTLTVNEKGKQQGRAVGHYYNHNQTHARNNAGYIDNKPGGDAIFVDTRHLFFYADCSTGDCAGAFHETGHDQSPRTTSGDWAADDAYQVLRPGSDRARGAIKVCEDHSFGGDPCSFTAYPTFGY